MSKHQQTEPPRHPEPPRQFKRFDDALYWLADCGWRQVGNARGSHHRLEHPDYTVPLILIRRESGRWSPWAQTDLRGKLHRLASSPRVRGHGDEDEGSAA